MLFQKLTLDPVHTQILKFGNTVFHSQRSCVDLPCWPERAWCRTVHQMFYLLPWCWGCHPTSATWRSPAQCREDFQYQHKKSLGIPHRRVSHHWDANLVNNIPSLQDMQTMRPLLSDKAFEFRGLGIDSAYDATENVWSRTQKKENTWSRLVTIHNEAEIHCNYKVCSLKASIPISGPATQSRVCMYLEVHDCWIPALHIRAPDVAVYFLAVTQSFVTIRSSDDKQTKHRDITSSSPYIVLTLQHSDIFQHGIPHGGLW